MAEKATARMSPAALRLYRWENLLLLHIPIHAEAQHVFIVMLVAVVTEYEELTEGPLRLYVIASTLSGRSPAYA